MHFRIFSEDTYIQRRHTLKKTIHSGIILFLGNNEAPMNYRDNTYRFRQDSTFLYYFGLDVAGLAAIIDIDSGEDTIFGTELTIDDVVWTGPLPTIQEMALKVGIKTTKDFSEIDPLISRAKNAARSIHFIPPYRYDNMMNLSKWLDIPVIQLKSLASLPLIKSIVNQRSIKEEQEIVEIQKAVLTTTEMHRAAMMATKPGMKEYEIVAAVHSEALKHGGDLSFPIILTVHGETLHNHYHGNTVKSGNMILCDAGSETDMHYAGDMTRTFPVDKTFTQKQKEIYNIVLDTHESCVKLLAPGIKYRDIYLHACEQLFDGLKLLGITKGDTNEAVKAGAHAMFFQCGLGHMMGLDVHDMEDLGEEYVGYTSTITKSKQFGMKSLRLGKELEAGFVLTVEPGIYFIPTLIDLWKSENKHSQFINYSRLEEYRDFGGIRVEEDFVITQDGYKLLGGSLPKTIQDIEELRMASLA